MTKLEKSELALVPLVGFGFFSISALLPSQLSIGNLILMLSALLLLQSLIRDVIILASRRVDQSATVKTMRCMCVESAFGMSGIVVGASILGFGIGPEVLMGKWTWAIAAILTFSVGFVIKDFILKTNPWRIVRDKNHLNIIVSWKQ
jgi:hypothetical protein